VLDKLRQLRQLLEKLTVGVTGTPSFVIGRTIGDTLNGILIVGAQPFEAFDTALRALLADGGIN
jgi:predicted DsbA family dithiol-disulfide isomerase